jgi:hypothetical protein
MSPTSTRIRTDQFERWFDEAARDIVEANAMVLSTGPGRSVERAVLLRDITDGAFVFYTNRQSRKGRTSPRSTCEPALSVVPTASSGPYRRRRDPVADDERRLLRSRPRESRAGAVASPQSEQIPSREWLEESGRGPRIGHDRPSRPLGWIRVDAGPRSSSGRVARIVCTTESGTREPTSGGSSAVGPVSLRCTCWDRRQLAGARPSDVRLCRRPTVPLGS